MGLGKSLVFLAAASGAVVIACSGPPPPLQAGLRAIVQGGIQAPAATCNRSGDFIDVPIASTDPNNVLVATGTEGIILNCSIVPQGGPGPAASYNVTVSAQVTTGTAPGTVTFTGIFTPRTRDGSGKPTADTTQIPNIRGDFMDQAGVHLVQKDCYAQYTEADPALLSGPSLPNAADVYADPNGGRIWISVFCPNAVNTNTSNQITKACQATTTFRFENCSSH
jgi:hypothetical protein